MLKLISNIKQGIVAFVIIAVVVMLIANGVSMLVNPEYKYIVDEDNLEISFNDDGSANIVEEISYQFRDEQNGVIWSIPVVGDQTIKVHKEDIEIDGAYGRVSVYSDYGTHNIKIYLYNDAEMTEKIHDAKVKIKVPYTFSHVVNKYYDVAEFHYTMWSAQADSVGKVSAKIHMASNENVEYWVNPYFSNKESSWDGNTLTITGYNIGVNKYFETRILTPLSYFSGATEVNQIYELGLDKLHQIQNDYANEMESTNTLVIILSIIMILSLGIPVLIWYKFGKEPVTGYLGEYERELPSNDSPAFVNALIGSGPWSIGSVDDNAFHATILDLTNRKYLRINKKGDGESTISILEKPDGDKLRSYEKDLIKMLSKFAKDGVLDPAYLEERLKSQTNAEWFSNKFISWKENIDEMYFGKDKQSRYYSKKGMHLMIAYGILSLFAAFIFWGSTSALDVPIAQYTGYISLAMVIFGIGSIVSSPVGNRWTLEGKELSEKWNNFEKYLTDFSYIREYPPESIAVWSHYLVYATALGCGDTVVKQMEEFVPPEILDSHDSYRYYNYNCYYMMNTNIISSHANSIDTSSSGTGGSFGGGGFGGVGGGFGGGGRGGF